MSYRIFITIEKKGFEFSPFSVLPCSIKDFQQMCRDLFIVFFSFILMDVCAVKENLCKVLIKGSRSVMVCLVKHSGSKRRYFKIVEIVIRVRWFSTEQVKKAVPCPAIFLFIYCIDGPVAGKDDPIVIKSRSEIRL